MFITRPKNKTLGREEKLAFAIEASLITLVFGVLFSQALLHLITLEPLTLYLTILRFLGHVFMNFMMGGIGIVLFGTLFRVTIYALDHTQWTPQIKQALSLLIGTALLLILSSFYFKLLGKETDWVYMAYVLLPYIFTFIIYNIYRDIWGAQASKLLAKEEELLDYSHEDL